MNKKLLWFIWITLLFWNILLQIDFVEARAGGSSSSRSSGGSSSSSFSSSNSYSTSSWSFNPIGIIVFIIIVVVIFNKIKKAPGGLQEVLKQIKLQQDGSKTIDITPAEDIWQKIATLKEKDPGFNEQQFLDRTSTAFFKIQNAWWKRDMNLARAYISDNVLRRFSLQLEEHIQNGVTNKLESLSLDNTKITDIQSDENFDTIDVWLTATAKDYMVKADSWEYVSGNKNEFVTWDEQWSFIRSSKAKTLVDKWVNVDKCPNCGAALSVNISGECEYCHSNVTKGDFDWVLAEITQLN